MELWWSEAKRDDMDDGGSFLGFPDRLVLHTTEGKTYASARTVYKAKRVAPTFTLSFESQVFKAWQHQPLNRAARALEHRSYTVDTNRANARQIEIVCCSDEVKAEKIGALKVSQLPDEFLAGIARCVGFILANTEIRALAPPHKPYPASYGKNNGVRFTEAQWRNFNGICSHMHVPNQEHGDAGGLDVDKIIGMLGIPPTDGGLDMDNLVDVVGCPAYGPQAAWALGTDGQVRAYRGAPYHGGMNGSPDFKNRVAKRFILTDDGLDYGVEATSGETYGPGGLPNQ